MSFIDAVRDMTLGWNGHRQLNKDEVGNKLLFFLDKFMRNMSYDDIYSHLIDLINEYNVNKDIVGIIYIFVAIMYTRNVRGGKEEKKLYIMPLLFFMIFIQIQFLI